MTDLPQQIQAGSQSYPARLTWVLGRSCSIHDDQPENPARIAQVLRILPKLPWLMELNEEAVFNISLLVKSIETPCDGFLITCSCGVADDALIEGGIEILHPAPDVIAWRFEVALWREYLDPQLSQQDGWVSVTFNRAEYAADVCAMLEAVQAAHAELRLDELQPNGFEIDEVAQLLQRLEAKNHHGS